MDVCVFTECLRAQVSKSRSRTPALFARATSRRKGSRSISIVYTGGLGRFGVETRALAPSMSNDRIPQSMLLAFRSHDLT